MNMRRAAKKDANHNEIAKEFERLGWIVLDLSQLKNCCDMAVTKEGRTFMVEVKDGSKPPSQRKLSEGEEKFKTKWLQGGLWNLVKSIDDVHAMNDMLEVWMMNDETNHV